MGSESLNQRDLPGIVPVLRWAPDCVSIHATLRIPMATSLLDQVLGRDEPAASPFTLVRAVEHGLPVQALDTLTRKLRLVPTELDLLIPRRTLLYRRKSVDKLLPTDVSDRLVRLTELVELATETFGTTAAALEWMRADNASLENRPPLELAMTSPGARIVENTLGRIQHGIGF
jgi:putative toxin-antitoxin system antitoxin component (TIGR02293 family)